MNLRLINRRALAAELAPQLSDLDARLDAIPVHVLGKSTGVYTNPVRQLLALIRQCLEADPDLPLPLLCLEIIDPFDPDLDMLDLGLGGQSTMALSPAELKALKDACANSDAVACETLFALCRAGDQEACNALRTTRGIEFLSRKCRGNQTVPGDDFACDELLRICNDGKRREACAARSRCLDANGERPYGDLHHVHQICGDRPPGCEGGVSSCREAVNNIVQNMACLQERKNLVDACYQRKADRWHVRFNEELYNNLVRCLLEYQRMKLEDAPRPENQRQCMDELPDFPHWYPDNVKNLHSTIIGNQTPGQVV